ncbi:MAG: CCA tRNA nucleotidyltransferase, partial [Pseudomonadota bacterium]
MTAPSPTSQLPPGGWPWRDDAAIAKVFEVLGGADGLTRIVGGPVRNALLGAPVDDHDFATVLLPDAVIARAKAAHIKAVPTGIDHGTVTLIVGKRPFEVTTLRQDVATDGRYAIVSFSSDWTQDAKRRDFTMNALSVDCHGQLFDPAGGYRDVMARRVRFIGDPDARIREDFLRILRFFRFSAWYSGLDALDQNGLDHGGLAACARHVDGLSRLSAERVGQETLKLLAAPRPDTALAGMIETGVAEAILGPLEPDALTRLDRLLSVEAVTDGPVEALVRLAVLLWPGVSRADGLVDVASRLRLSNAERQRLVHMVAYMTTLSDGDERSAKALLVAHGTALHAAGVLAASAAGTADDGAWRALLTLPERWVVPDFP